MEENSRLIVIKIGLKITNSLTETKDLLIIFKHASIKYPLFSTKNHRLFTKISNFWMKILNILENFVKFYLIFIHNWVDTLWINSICAWFNRLILLCKRKLNAPQCQWIHTFIAQIGIKPSTEQVLLVPFWFAVTNHHNLIFSSHSK